MDFLGDRLDELVRGWKKASAVKQKLLLKRALLGVVVSATETKIIYLNSGQQESDLVAGGTEESSFETEVLGKIVNGIGSDTKKPSRDEKVLSAFRIKIGRGELLRTWRLLPVNLAIYTQNPTPYNIARRRGFWVVATKMTAAGQNILTVVGCPYGKRQNPYQGDNPSIKNSTTGTSAAWQAASASR